MENELNNIQLRSDEVQEILGHIPSRLIRYGITVIVSIIFVLFIGSFFFKYPDILIAPVEVVSENPPASIAAKTSGSLSNVLVADSQVVQANQRLAVIKNPAKLSDVEWLKSFIAKIEINQLLNDNAWLDEMPDTLQLGEIQHAFTAFQKQAIEFLQFKDLHYYPKKISSLKQNQSELKKYVDAMARQVVIKEKDFLLAKNQFARDSGLFEKEVISLSEIENSNAKLLQNNLSLESTRSAKISASMQMNELQQQITDLELEALRTEQNYVSKLSELKQNLESNIAGWADAYVLISPIDGVVAFNKIWSSNQFVDAGNEVFNVIPQIQSTIIGRITLPSKGAGKVKINQHVNLKFDNFPYQEFGMVTAKVSSISLVPLERNYTIEVNLSDTLTTNYGINLPFSQKMLGSAEIITEDLPLIARIFNPLKAIFKKHWSAEY